MSLTKKLAIIKRRYNIIGHAPALERAVTTALQVAPTEMSVLISGENGSGKEAFAHILHDQSTHKHGKLISVNCAAIPEGTIDSELFGHEKGAFTDATEKRKGYFEEANEGTIFLDEIAEMPLSTQAKLLRLLEQGTFMRVGSSKESHTQVRVIAATHVDLLKAVNRRTFRQDLYHRLCTITLAIPPLRERGEDILLLFKKFALDFAEKYHIQPLKLTPNASRKLLTYPFPGNVRQLKNLVYQMAVFNKDQQTINTTTLTNYLAQAPTTAPALIHLPGSPSNTTDAERELFYKLLLTLQEDLQAIKAILLDQLQHHNTGQAIINSYPSLFRNLVPKSYHATNLLPALAHTVADHTDDEKQPTTPSTSTAEEHRHAGASLNLEAQEKMLITKALAQHNHNRREAAKALGVAERTLYRKIKAYNLALEEAS